MIKLINKYFFNNKYIIWIVDDRIENQVMIAASFKNIKKHINIVKLNSCQEYYSAVDKCNNGTRPHFIFMDYFMGENYGTELIKYAKNKRYLVGFPIIIGHSSNLDASHEMVKVGGDFVLEKIKGLEYSASIVKHFSDIIKVREIINNRSLNYRK